MVPEENSGQGVGDLRHETPLPPLGYHEATVSDLEDLINFGTLIDLRNEHPTSWKAMAELQLDQEVGALQALAEALPYVEDMSLPDPVLPPRALPLPKDPIDRGPQTTSTKLDVRAAAESGARSVEEIASQCWIPVSRVESALIDIAAEASEDEPEAPDYDLSAQSARDSLRRQVAILNTLRRAVKAYLRSDRDKAARKKLRRALKDSG